MLYYKCVGGKSFLSCLFSWFITIIVSLFINLSSGSISYGGISVTVIYSKNTHTYFILSCVLIPLIGFLLFDEENRNRKNYYEIARLLAEKNMFSCHTIIDDSTHSNNSRNSTGDSYGCHNSYRNNNINTHLSNTNINRTSTVGINRYSSSNLLPSEELKYSCIREFRAILSNVSHDIKSVRKLYTVHLLLMFS